mmetsp:Transcript_5555/g.22487  ORF Transcript_5555/g.22487 Transcript_5555/m.22487 type:complete len:252 (+) Transcript_5555:369-1124(+)
MRLEVRSRAAARLRGGGHRGDEVALDAEGREEGVQVARQAERHRLGKLRRALGVERGVEVQHEDSSGVFRKDDFLRRAPADAQQRADEARQRHLLAHLPLERPEVRPGGQSLVHELREDVLRHVLLRYFGKRVEAKLQNLLRAAHLSGHRVVQRLLEHLDGQVRFATVPSAVHLVHLAVRAVMWVVLHQTNLRPHRNDRRGVVTQPSAARLDVVNKRLVQRAQELEHSFLAPRRRRQRGLHQESALGAVHA